MPFPVASSPDDPRLADFVALNDPTRRREIERRGNWFVVEGALALDQLLRVGGWQVRRVALLPRAAERLGPRLADLADRVVVAPEAVLRAVVGFDLHRGVLASVERVPPRSVAEVVVADAPQLLVALEGVNDHENLGAVYRNAAGFGSAAVVVDPATADPFYRRSVRVSLGHVLTVPTATMASAPAGIEELRSNGATVVALTPAGDADLRTLDRGTLGTGPLVVLAGAEGPGLSRAALDAADVRAAIAMPADVDSLNVATAVALALYQLGG